MKIVYMSLTGNVRLFVNKLNTSEPLELKTGDEVIDEDFLLITYTPDMGEIPYEVEDFLEVHSQYCKGVVASGDKSYGPDFTMVAQTISDQYDIPIVHRFELDGKEEDVLIVNEFINS